MTATSAGVLYNSSANTDTNGTTTLTCMRTSAEANSLTYRLKADTSSNYNGNRRVSLSSTSNYLTYYMRRGTSGGGSATCSNSSNWFAPTTGTSNVITGTLSFGASLIASAVWGYCLRVRGTAGGNPSAPTAGIYTDLIDVFAQYPGSDSGTLTAMAQVTYAVGVTNQCVFNTFPGSISFNYTAFSTTIQTASTSFALRCSNGLPWSISISPGTTTLLGLNYSITASPAAGVGNGNTGQTVSLTGNMPANQAGTCSTGTCTASQVHTVTITY
ncbi:hypothetical protein [Cupriavidus sp. D39]|uniref:hypothetical protein n=1 Tax=Cupriavidus sp. D39 TaxID=2997877 RepID=UPI002271B972|nr:hypothetical protein [Cupriavidus sp. D39]MCY0858729.1 hypothetical protein [Cupriavidus sp. D39]